MPAFPHSLPHFLISQAPNTLLWRACIRVPVQKMEVGRPGGGQVR